MCIRDRPHRGRRMLPHRRRRVSYACCTHGLCRCHPPPQRPCAPSPRECVPWGFSRSWATPVIERGGRDQMSEPEQIGGKLMSLERAVRTFVKNGDQVALGGFTISRDPMALAYEIARQRIGDLHLVAHSNGQALDVLVGAGCVRRIEIAYGGNGRFAPTCIRFRKAVERGELQVEDYS